MICAECEKEGKKSKTFVGPSQTTCMGYAPYYDEEGQYHLHDRNTTTTFYHCSNGHSWTIKRKPGTCACGWKAESD